MTKEKICGIYQIRNMVNQKRYVGGSVDIKRRWSDHIRDLERGTHGNPHLQYSWNKHGRNNFSFELLEIVRKKRDVKKIEQKHLDRLKDCDFNISNSATSPMLGRCHSSETKKKQSKSASKENHPFWGKKHSDDTKKKQSEAKAGKNCYMWKRSVSEKTRAKMSIAQAGERGNGAKLTSEKVLKIRFLHKSGDFTTNELSKMFDVVPATIGDIVKRKTWKYI